MFLVVLDFRKLIRKISELHDFKGDISQKPKKKKIVFGSVVMVVFQNVFHL
jgi:hypothetical protein